ncbi:hypothetical protein [Maricaulis sp.]|uniref:hypothetical protein n=1 Tax=Maricaulis sp. TaxID=1486257 RepID=UPI0026019BAB|nr:hypothetical protein [Maricaulis sp.]
MLSEAELAPFASGELAKTLGPLLYAPNGVGELRPHALAPLVWATLHHAQDVPYWSERMPDEGDLAPLDWLAKIPSVRRDDLDRQRQDFLSPRSTFAFCSFTSSTSTGRSLLIERGREEALYIRNFFAVMQARRPQPALKGLGLQAVNINHGDLLSAGGSSGYSFPVNLYVATGYATAANLLTQDFTWPGWERRIGSLNGSFSCLYRLARYMDHHGYELEDGQLLSAVAFASPIPPAARDYLQGRFGTRLHDNYSMTEAFGSAAYCDECDGYHMAPFIWDEVLDTDEDRPVADGEVGELTITPLFPFAQRFVLLRYRTGDLAVRFKSICKRGGQAIRLLGRKRNAVRLADGGWVGSIPVASALFDEAELHRPENNIEIDGDRTCGEFPWMKLSSNEVGDKAYLDIAPTFGANSDSARMQSIVDRILDRLPDLPLEVRAQPLETLSTGGTWKL